MTFPEFEAEGVRLINGDCLDVMPTLEAGSVDLILSDLPYGTTCCRWDTVIPFEPLWACFKRVLKPKGAVVLTASQPFTSMLVMSNREWFRYTQIWEKHKPTSIFQAKVRPLVVHEEIAVFTKSKISNRIKSSTYNPQGVRASSVVHRQSARTNVSFSPRPSHAAVYACQGTGYPRSVVRFPGDSGLHPTQKPVALFEYLIRTYSNAGETILDATIGSGTTAIAAINTDRRCVGIERDPTYFATACGRVKDTRLPLLAR